MGEIFDTLCKGPIIVIDDKVGEGDDLINKLVSELDDAKLPVLSYTSLGDARRKLGGLSFTNFIIMDWNFLGVKDSEMGVVMGADAETQSESEVMELIGELQKTCMAPIFIISALDREGILAKLDEAGISTQEKNSVFVENKNILCETPGKLIAKIEEWITNSPHVYLTKAWTNEWNSKLNSIFWELYKLNPNWPTLFYKAFEKDGEEPVISLRDTIFQLIYSQINMAGIDTAHLVKDFENTDETINNESLKVLYQKLVYSTMDIDKDVRPGDVFKKEGSYYLNIRPECDTTKRLAGDPDIYVLKGDIRFPERIIEERTYQPFFGIIDKEYEITMPLLDGNPFVVFSKRKLSVKDYAAWKRYKICRVNSPFITRIRHSYSSYIGRFGVPSYPEQIIESLVESARDEETFCGF